MHALVRPFRRRMGMAWAWPPGYVMSSPVLRWLFLIVFANLLLNAVYAPLLRWSPLLSWTADLLAFVVVTAVLIGAAITRGKVSLRDLGLKWTTYDRHGGLVLAVMVVSVPFASVLVYGLDLKVGHLMVPGSRPLSEASWSGALSATGAWRDLMVVYLSVTAGLTEELVFRAVLLRIATPWVAHSWRYVALSAVLFGLIHWERGPASIVATGLFGAYMAVLYRSSGNLWPSIVGHMAVDSFAFSMMARHA